jgi:protein-disulfide isomerase
LTPPVGERDHVQGAASAPVTLVEYGDYECPYCGQAHPIVKAIQQQVGDRLRFVFRNFPLANMHPHAQHAAEAAEAAGALGNFWPMHDLLYENQEVLEDDDLLQYAAALGLDAERFRGDLVRHVHASRVREDFLSGARSGVNGTPTFFLNGVRYDESWDFDTLLHAIHRTVASAGRA